MDNAWHAYANQGAAYWQRKGQNRFVLNSIIDLVLQEINVSIMKRSFFYTLSIVLGLLAAQCGSNTKPAESNNASGADSQLAKAKTDTVVMLAGINSKGIGRFQNIKWK